MMMSHTLYLLMMMGNGDDPIHPLPSSSWPNLLLHLESGQEPSHHHQGDGDVFYGNDDEGGEFFFTDFLAGH